MKDGVNVVEFPLHPEEPTRDSLPDIVAELKKSMNDLNGQKIDNIMPLKIKAMVDRALREAMSKGFIPSPEHSLNGIEFSVTVSYDGGVTFIPKNEYTENILLMLRTPQNEGKE